MQTRNLKQKYLPPNGEDKLYSPVGVLGLFKKAVEDEKGDISAVFSKANKYKQLIELWYASALAVAMHKWTGDKFFMYPSDSPDIHFVKKSDEKQEGFSVEIMTLFDYDQKSFDGDYEKLVSTVWKRKGKKDYDRTELLLVSRLVGQIDIDKFADLINKHDWKFLRIWLSVYNSSDNTWTLFEISPYKNEFGVGKITVELKNLPY